MIKYIGSKRALLERIVGLTQALSPQGGRACDLFSGGARVGHALKAAGFTVHANDHNAYAHTLAVALVQADATRWQGPAERLIAELNAVRPEPGWFTRTYCEDARYFHPDNGMRIDAIRAGIEEHYTEEPLRSILLTSLLLAADAVDSTVGLQMAYLKQWAPRALGELRLKPPALTPTRGRAVRGDAVDLVHELPPVDLAYLDPPYNHHRYFTNYHVWETLVRWDEPETYGVARKRVDARDDSTRSVFNHKRAMPAALADLLCRARAEVVVVSYNDESWVSPEQMTAMLHDAGHEDVRLLAFDSKRYVGAQIGIFGPSGEKVGTVARLRNTEYLFVAGPRERVEAAVTG